VYVFTGTQCILQPRAESRPDSDPRTISQSLHAVNLVRLLVSSSSVSGGCPRAETLWTRRHSVERTLPATLQQSSLCAKCRKDDSNLLTWLFWSGSGHQRCHHFREHNTHDLFHRSEKPCSYLAPCPRYGELLVGNCKKKFEPTYNYLVPVLRVIPVWRSLLRSPDFYENCVTITNV